MNLHSPVSPMSDALHAQLVALLKSRNLSGVDQLLRSNPEASDVLHAEILQSGDPALARWYWEAAHGEKFSGWVQVVHATLIDNLRADGFQPGKGFSSAPPLDGWPQMLLTPAALRALQEAIPCARWGVARLLIAAAPGQPGPLETETQA